MSRASAAVLGARGRRDRRRESDDEAWLEPAPLTGTQVLLFLLIIGLPLAIGGVHVATRIVAFGLGTVAVIWRAVKLEREGLRLTPGAWGLALGAAALMAFLQWVPWPAGLVAALSPERAALANDLAAAIGEGPPAFMPLAFDASLVAIGLVGLLLHLQVFLLGRHLRPDARVRERLVIAVEIAALLVVVAGAVHQLAGFDKLLGFHEASVPNAGGPFPTTFVNPNHMAALCLFAALLAFGAAIAVKPRMLWHSAMGAVASFGVVASLSRANAALLVVGLLLVGLPWVFARTDDDRPVRARRLLIGIFALMFIGLVMVGPELWWFELKTILDADTPFANFTGLTDGVWQVGWDAARTSPLVGLGSGNLGLGTPAVMPVAGLGLVTHAHLGPVEVLGELGFVAGGLVLLLIAVGVVMAAPRAWGNPLVWSGLVALVMVAAQNLVDFSLWIPGVGVAAAAIAGMVSVYPEGPPKATTATRRVVLGVGLGVVVVGVLAAWHGWSERPGAWRADAEAALGAGTTADWKGMVRQHGADFMSLEYAGLLAEREGEVVAARKLAVIGLARAPVMPSTIGRAFKFAVLDGDDVAAHRLVESLMVQGPSGSERGWELVLSARNRLELLALFFGSDGARLLTGASRVEGLAGREAAIELLRWGFKRFPDDPLIAEALGSRLGLDLAHRDERAGLVLRCLAKAGEAKGEAERGVWERVGFYFEGESAMKNRRYNEAFRLFMGAAEPSGAGGQNAERDKADSERRLRALFLAADAAFAAKSLAMADEVMALIDAETIEHPWNIGHRHVLRSMSLEMKRDWRPAIRELQSAIRLQHHVVRHHRRLADLFEKAGDPEAATRSRLRANAIENP